MVGLKKVCNLQNYMQLHFFKVINIITKQNINKNNKNMPIKNNHGPVPHVAYLIKVK